MRRAGAVVHRGWTQTIERGTNGGAVEQVDRPATSRPAPPAAGFPRAMPGDDRTAVAREQIEQMAAGET